MNNSPKLNVLLISNHYLEIYALIQKVASPGYFGGFLIKGFNEYDEKNKKGYEVYQGYGFYYSSILKHYSDYNFNTGKYYHSSNLNVELFQVENVFSVEKAIDIINKYKLLI